MVVPLGRSQSLLVPWRSLRLIKPMKSFRWPQRRRKTRFGSTRRTCPTEFLSRTSTTMAGCFKSPRSSVTSFAVLPHCMLHEAWTDWPEDWWFPIHLGLDEQHWLYVLEGPNLSSHIAVPHSIARVLGSHEAEDLGTWRLGGASGCEELRHLNDQPLYKNSRES